MDGLVGLLDGFLWFLVYQGFYVVVMGSFGGVLWGFLFGVLGFSLFFFVSFVLVFLFLFLFFLFPGFTTSLQAASWGFTPHPFFLLLLGKTSTPLTTTLYYYSYYYQGMGSFTLLPSTEAQTIASLATTIISQHLSYHQGSSIVLFSPISISHYYWERSLEQAAFSAGCSRWF